MHQLLWLAIAWIGGTAAILGSLMLLGSLLLWLAPSTPIRTKKSNAQSTANNVTQLWQNRLTLTAFAAAIALTGISLLTLIPFPHR